MECVFRFPPSSVSWACQIRRIRLEVRTDLLVPVVICSYVHMHVTVVGTDLIRQLRHSLWDEQCAISEASTRSAGGFNVWALQTPTQSCWEDFNDWILPLIVKPPEKYTYMQTITNTHICMQSRASCTPPAETMLYMCEDRWISSQRAGHHRRNYGFNRKHNLLTSSREQPPLCFKCYSLQWKLQLCVE